MAPKKKPPPPKKKKKETKGSKAPKTPKDSEFEEKVVPEHSREFFLIQIRDLENRLFRYQAKWDEMQASEELFRTEYEKMFKDNKEIVAFLKKSLNQRMDEISELTEQLQLLQQAKDTEKDAFEAQLAQLRHEFQETKDQLTSENMVLSGKLAALEDFRLHREEITARFAALEGQLKKREDEHKEIVYNLERKAVLDKERLKREMIHRVNAVAAEFRKVSNSQMAETTKRTIRENVTISLQLTKMTEQSLHLIQENDKLKEANADAMQQLELLEQNEKTMAKNCLSNQKMIVMLTKKCKDLEAQLEQYVNQHKVLMELQDAHNDLQIRNSILQEELEIQKAEMETKMVDDKGQEKALEEERKRRINAERVLRHAAQGLKAVLLERPSEEERDEGHFNVVFQLRRNDMLKGVVSVLNKSIAHLEASHPLRPYRVETEMVPVEEVESRESVAPARLSQILSHTDIFRIVRPQAIHSMPSLSRLSRICLDSMRPYASATELRTLEKTEIRRSQFFIEPLNLKLKDKPESPQSPQSHQTSSSPVPESHSSSTPRTETPLSEVVSKQALKELFGT